MGQSVIKNPRRVVSQQGTGGGSDPALEARVTYLEGNQYKITYFTTINGTTGTITAPTGSTILTDQFFGGVDAYVSTIANGQPTGIFPQTAGGTEVDVSSFDASGNFVLTGTPSAYPVALIYKLKIAAVNYQNLTTANILDLEDINIITQSITNGDTTHSPSGDAVFDALALKQSVNNKLVTLVVTSGSPADGITYFHGRPVAFTQNTTHANANNIYVPNGCTSIKYVSVTYDTQSVGSNELVSSYVRVTNTTDYTISTNIDLSNQVQFRELTTPITGLTAGVDYLQIKTVCPTWVTTNPTSVTLIVVVQFE